MGISGALGRKAGSQTGSTGKRYRGVRIPSPRGTGAIPEDHPLALGCIGLYGTRAANSYMRWFYRVLLSIHAREAPTF